MAKVRYVCLSDLHFGEDRSLFSNMNTDEKVDYSAPSPLMIQFVECLKTILPDKADKEKRILILNGDILELAFCEMHLGGTVFRQFVRLIMHSGNGALFDRIIFIPGNHDHHLWEMARETQYLNYLNRKHKKQHPNGKDKELPKPWHTTELFLEGEKNPVPASFLSEVTKPIRGRRPIWTAYPNLALLDKEGSKCVVFHHGHFTESTYWLVSETKKKLFGLNLPRKVWRLEEENYAWIDFVWSALGRSGEAGRGLEDIYNKLLRPETLENITNRISKMIAQGSSSLVIDCLDFCNQIENWLNDAARDHWHSERSNLGKKLTEDGERCLARYLEYPLRNHIADRLRFHHPILKKMREKLRPDPSSVEIPETTFVFGHTHKPYYNSAKFNHYDKPVQVYNTGGWVVDSLTTAPCHGGSIVLVDDNLETALLWIYNESYDHKDFPGQVKCVGTANNRANELSSQTELLINKNRKSWENLSKEIARSVSIRRNHLYREVNQPI